MRQNPMTDVHKRRNGIERSRESRRVIRRCVSTIHPIFTNLANDLTQKTELASIAEPLPSESNPASAGVRDSFPAPLTKASDPRHMMVVHPRVGFQILQQHTERSYKIVGLAKKHFAFAFTSTLFEALSCGPSIGGVKRADHTL
jgi:hypothetical protein